MDKIEFTVYGSPVAQPQTKAQGFIKNGKALAHVYEPGGKDSPARQWKHEVKQAALGQFGKDSPLWDGPLRLSVRLFLPRPQSLYREKDPSGEIYHAAGKDIDNLFKAISDALNGIVYRDDKQIAEAHVAKFYHEKQGRPRAEIVLERLTN
jgi:Holliday junction resolvase RusA-like endonuclease